jgi:membrane-bound lytic murein transglycosylase F
MMQLTTITADRFDIVDREDPRQSVLGGARYLRHLMDRLPPEIQDPDRTWLALAAYNVGFGHLKDARILTLKNGRDPNKWVDVKEFLPLLSVPKWYKKTKHGYARGHEPVSYVTRIRSFHDILVKIDDQDERRQVAPKTHPQVPAA